MGGGDLPQRANGRGESHSPHKNGSNNAFGFVMDEICHDGKRFDNKINYETKNNKEMSIGYIRKKQKLNHNGTVKDVYLAKVCYTNHIDTNTLAEEISKMCSASPADVLMHLRAMEDCIGAHIANGDVVKMDSLGAFYPTIRSTAMDSPEKVNQHSIKGLGMLFRPSQRLMEIIKKAGVNLMDKRVFDAETRSKTKK